MDTRRVVPKLEFYITNVCNLTCDGCNRFNDLPFRGHQRWADYERTLERWAEKIIIEHPVIMGGEPLLNPDIKLWITGITKLFGAPQVLSNGTYIHKVSRLYECLYPPLPDRYSPWIGVSLHDGQDKDKIYDNIRNFFPHPTKELDPPDTKLQGIKTFIDHNQVFVEVWDQTEFKPNAVKIMADGRLTLHQNRPENAFRICAFQHHKNYHFIRGKIYRCGPVALFPELDDQFNLVLSSEDKQLIRSYRPLSIDDYDQRADDFFEHIDDMLPQCKFCSADDRYHPLVFHDHKKKRVNII